MYQFAQGDVDFFLYNIAENQSGTAGKFLLCMW